MVSDPRESKFYLAAEKAIADLKTEEERLKEEVRKGRQAAKRKTAWNIVLTIVVAATILIGFQQRQNEISGCQAGNLRAAGTVAAFHELVVLSEGPAPTAAVKEKAAVFENFVSQHNAPRDCSQAYSIWP